MLKSLKEIVLFSKKVFSIFPSNVTLGNKTGHLLGPVRTFALRKRFYKSTSILKSEGKYEITLDQRKLKTPKGNLFVVESEPLALAVAHEWDSQKDKIMPTKMHLTTLCNTVLDNPNNLTKFDIVNYIVNYMETDTLLYQTNEEEEDLCKLQTNKWDPVIEWFNQRYGVGLKKSRDMEGVAVSDRDRSIIQKYLLSYNFWAVNGFMYGVDSLKSVILTCACIERFISCEEAVLLSRLEEEYQANRWGRVEWAHDLSQQSLQTKMSAVVLFVYFNSQSSSVITKSKK